MAILENSKNFLLMTILFLSGCMINVTLSAEFFPRSFSVSIYELDSKRNNEPSEYTINPDDKLYKVLKKWYLDNLSEWEYDITTYAPSIYFFDKNFMLNLSINGKMVVINYLDSNKKWKQVSKRLSGSDVITLKQSLDEFFVTHGKPDKMRI
jgi:hypothetical protein